MAEPLAETIQDPEDQSTATTRETLLEALGKDTRSPLQKYRELYVGDGSFMEFLKYEVLTFFLSAIPGAPGYFLRKTLYRGLFESIGGGVVIGPHVTLRCPRHISIRPRSSWAKTFRSDRIAIYAPASATSSWGRTSPSALIR